MKNASPYPKLVGCAGKGSDAAVTDRLPFQIDARASGSSARATTFRTRRGEVRTPIFMPVGTQATVKAQLPETLEEQGFQVLLANTYHLMLRPGVEVFEALGGIHSFMRWPGAVLTDSGGYQIFSLPHSRAINEEGAVFQSYVDGRELFLSPETSIAAQQAIGSEIMMVLDQCVASTSPESLVREALERTTRWAARSLAARNEDSRQALFAIVQGALSPELRRRSAGALVRMPFDGFAIGGLAVGESKSEREDICELSAGLLPAEKPRYLMGVGTPLDLLEAVHRGVDMFDCIIPTQVAKWGGAFTSRGFLQLRRGVFKFSEEALDPACTCPVCAKYSRAYLHHLTKTREPLGWQLIGQHNLHFYRQLMREMREAILADSFLPFYHAKRAILVEDDLDHPVKKQKAAKEKARRLGDYEVHEAREGFASILHVQSGEIMHSRTPPMEEAQNLYTGQARLRERLLEPAGGELVVWDVGLGAGANAMAAIACREKLVSQNLPARELCILSFENDLDSLRLAFRHREKFPYLRHAGPAAILQAGCWQAKNGPGLRWQLVEGSFPESMHAAIEPPDLIFYDLFSGKTHSDAWTLRTFCELFAICAGRDVELFTYTCSTAARVAMLGAGFFVARGRPAGAKQETTIALTAEAAARAVRRGTAEVDRELLASDWLAKWRRSSARFPSDLPEGQRGAFEGAILGHAQFSSPPVGQ